MIHPDRMLQALKALQRLISHAKAQAYGCADAGLAELLNDIELLPDFVADGQDRTEDFVEMLQGIAQAHPSCRYIVEEFQGGRPTPEVFRSLPSSP